MTSAASELGRSHLGPADGPRSAAVVGAGVGGAAAARRLSELGWRVEVFDKGRGPGGRSSTRREAGWSFDHGAQYFTARGPRLQTALAPWLARGVVAPWHGRFVRCAGDGDRPDPRPRWVGTPGMSALVAGLLDGLPAHWSARVDALERRGDGWALGLEGGAVFPGFDAVVVALPAPQAVALVAGVAPALAARAAAVPMAPCWAAMLAFERRLELPFDGARLDGPGPLAWLARDASKPQRRAGDETWVLHSSAGWATAHLEDDRDRVAEALLGALQVFAARWGARPAPVHARAHRWRYARAVRSVGEPCLVDAATGLALAGDWLLGARVEAAYESGAAAAERLHAARSTSLWR